MHIADIACVCLRALLFAFQSCPLPEAFDVDPRSISCFLNIILGLKMQQSECPVAEA